MGIDSAYSSESAVVGTVFHRRSPNDLWHRATCPTAQGWTGYKADVEDPIQDFPVYSMVASCCATKDEKTASMVRMAGRAA